MRPLALAWAICAAVAAAQRQRFGAVDSSNLVPRYLIDQSFPLARRAAACGEGTHSCEDIGWGGQCCENTRYCYVNGEGLPKCCPIGSNCLNFGPCSSDKYYCTITPTATATGSVDEDEDEEDEDEDEATGTATNSPSSTAVSMACCPRACPGTSQYRCPGNLGGGCCGYDSECRVGDQCVFALTSSTTMDADAASLTPADEGCTTSQHACDDGLGCCDNNYQCTAIDGEGWCAPGRQTEDAGADDDGGGDGLSDGAKVGIGVGSVIGAGIIFGALVWWFIRRRRRARSVADQATQPSAGGGGVQARPPQQRHQSQDHTAMTDITASSRHYRGYAPAMGDPEGLSPVAGPYTTGSMAFVPPSSPGSSPGPPGRAVPSLPNQPEDIAAAVELDSNASPDPEEHDGRMSPESGTLPSYFTAAVPIHAVEGTFELYSPQSEYTPSFPSPNAPPHSPTNNEHGRGEMS